MTDVIGDDEGWDEVQAKLEALVADMPTVLPQARLEQLAEQGIILSVMTFEDHMNPQVHWIEPEEFGKAFRELTDEEPPMPDDRFEAAHTDPGNLPSFINARKGLVPGTVLITVRSDMQAGEPGSVEPTPSDPLGQGVHATLDGATAYHVMDIQDFDQWIADLMRLRQALAG